MTKEKKFLIDVAEKLCIPAMERAINNFIDDKVCLVADHISFECSKMEELFRPLWGIAPLLSKKKYTITVCGQECDLAEALRKVILIGSDENDPRCFSRFASNRHEHLFANQMITEFAPLCIAMTQAPEVLWESYSDEEKLRVASWIRNWAVCALENSWQNNHYWFPMLAVTALEKLGIDCGDVDSAMSNGFAVLDSMYISHGWYKDGAFGRFDFYLAWSHHVYPILWASLAEGTRFYDKVRAETYKKRTEEFFDYFTHMFDADGSVPAFGRSLSYRFAESAYFAAVAYASCDVDLGLARRIIVKNVSYFMDNMIMPESGVLPTGYLYESVGLAENYTSSGGAYWCAKTFLVLDLPDDHPFWTADESTMPIEDGEFLINSAPENIDMLLEGTKEAGVTLYNNSAMCYTFENGCGGRFGDMPSCYSKFVYNSRAGFGISSPDMISLDNMIALETSDAAMTSRRNGFINEGVKDGIIRSSHKPFSNDDSVITTWMLPLGGGYHLRAHKVTLTRAYRVIEGGFSVGAYDDSTVLNVTREFASISCDGKISKIKTVASVPVNYRIDYHMPSLHLLAPTSAYPVYTTDVLEAGEYIFASVFGFTDRGELADEPGISLNGNTVTVAFKGNARTVVIE